MALRRLFVYGSLRRSGRHHEELRGARFLGEAVTRPVYALEERGGYPALVPGSVAVPGELFEVDEALLLELDDFEGPAYRRAEVELARSAPGAPGAGDSALAYLARTR